VPATPTSVLAQLDKAIRIAARQLSRMPQRLLCGFFSRCGGIDGGRGSAGIDKDEALG